MSSQLSSEHAPLYSKGIASLTSSQNGATGEVRTMSCAFHGSHRAGNILCVERNLAATTLNAM